MSLAAPATAAAVPESPERLLKRLEWTVLRRLDEESRLWGDEDRHWEKG